MRTVAENARPGDAVGDPVWATHPDELEIAYSLSGTDTASFAVDKESGQIRMKEGMDLAIGRSYHSEPHRHRQRRLRGHHHREHYGDGGLMGPYDRNGDDRIDRDEVLRAVSDYFKGLVEKDEVIGLIKLYFQGDG